MITNQPLHRREVVKCLLAERKDLLVVSGLGSATYDCAAAGDNEKNFEKRISLLSPDGVMLDQHLNK